MQINQRQVLKYMTEADYISLVMVKVLASVLERSVEAGEVQILTEEEKSVFLYPAIPEEEFGSYKSIMVPWSEIRLGEYYIKLNKTDWCHWAHEARITEVSEGKISFFNYKRMKITEANSSSFGGYGDTWFFVKVRDYKSPIMPSIYYQ